MFCENCGAKIPDGARFCDQCGQPSAAPPAKGLSQPPRPPEMPGARPPSAFPQPPKAPPAKSPPGQPAMPRPPEPPRPSVGDLPLASSTPPPPATPRAGSLPAMPRLPQAPPSQGPAQDDVRTQGFAPPQPPGAPRSGFPPPQFGVDAGPGADRPYLPTAPAPDVNLPQAVTLVLLDTNAPLVLGGREQYEIGREDPEDGVFPNVDLTLSGGEAAGVSRRHAILTYRNGTYWLEDLDSLNYTFVNGVRLDPRQPHPLRDGDEVWFARLRTRFYLGSAAPDPWR